MILLYCAQNQLHPVWQYCLEKHHSLVPCAGLSVSKLFLFFKLYSNRQSDVHQRDYAYYDCIEFLGSTFFTFLQMTTASDVVKQVLGHMTSNDNPSHITVKKGQLRSVLFY